METKNIKHPTATDLAEMSHRIRSLKATTRQSNVETGAAFKTQVRAIEDQYDLLVAKFNRAALRMPAAPPEVQNGISEAWGKLEQSLDRAVNYLH